MEQVIVEETLMSKVAGKKEKKKLFSAKFCPRCGSTDVYWAQGMPQLWSVWDCKNCGYRGAFILEDGNLAEKLQVEWQQKNKKEKT
ncbi:MAG: hypothetical protein NWE92_01100 [Candidatus Bathyarchaeota archaeon]|nr:hypothetical protein [Candidatus Bathyarchaeota archaeon]